jgi:hypothetical protein
MDTSTRLPGHGLLSEGKPHEQGGTSGRYERIFTAPFEKSGHGACSCGEASPVLESDSARRKWHRAHKDEIRAAAGAEPAP